MKLPNNYGSVTKLSGNRRNPYMARVTTDCVYDEIKEDYVQTRKVIGYYHTRKEALEALASYHDNPYAALDANMSTETLWNMIKDNIKVSDERKVVYRRLYNNYFDPISKMRIKDVKTKHLQQIIDSCDKGYSTKSNLRALMHQIFKYACQNDIVDKDYADFITFEKEATQIQREIYTSEEIADMWKKSDLDEYAMTLILIYQGMRIKEFRDLRADNVDFDAMTISIPKGKNRYSIRTIPIHNKALPLLKQLLNKYGDRFTDTTAKQYEYFCNNMFHHNAYDCRHTFGTKGAALQIPVLHMQKIMGHKPDTLLESVYTHLTIEDLAEAINKIEY